MKAFWLLFIEGPFSSPLPSWTLITHLLKLEAIPKLLNLCLFLIFFICVLQLNSFYCIVLTFQISYVVSSLVFGEGNDNPLQCSCLENPRDGGAWWAAVYGIAQSQMRLKWLSSSSLILSPPVKLYTSHIVIFFIPESLI